MYDARSNSGGGADRSNMIFGLAAIAIVVVCFVGVLMIPGGKSAGVSLPAAMQSDSILLTKLNDPVTKSYVTTLNRVYPNAAAALEESAQEAVSRGASKDELAQLAVQSSEIILTELIPDLAKADVKHFDRILNHVKAGMTRMSSKGNKWCKGATFERYADMNPISVQAQLQTEILGSFKYGKPAYNWSVELNTIMLEAAADGRENPKSYGKFSAADERAVQAWAMGLMADPQIMKLIMLQNASKSKMQSAIRGMDFCKLGASMITSVNKLPKDLRGRAWAEGFRQINSGDLEKMMGQMGGF